MKLHEDKCLIWDMQIYLEKSSLFGFLFHSCSFIPCTHAFMQGVITSIVNLYILQEPLKTAFLSVTISHLFLSADETHDPIG